MLGINMIENFRHPYAAVSPTDFWRRWHISLSTWFRDYVYIPLGGNRGGRLLEARNVLFTFLLSGLWHGANWNYVAWGGYWGTLIVTSRYLGSLLPKSLWEMRGVRIVQIALMFVLTNIGWLLFRETDFHYLAADLAQSPWRARSGDWEAAGYFSSLVLIYASPLVVHYVVDRGRDGNKSIVTAPAYSLWLRTLGSTAMFFSILVLRTANSGDFIYFRF
jgi:D-alanyl-lipoteichoic acid acyltransferase DltB (MBOAT superfamily)